MSIVNCKNMTILYLDEIFRFGGLELFEVGGDGVGEVKKIFLRVCTVGKCHHVDCEWVNVCDKSGVGAFFEQLASFVAAVAEK